MASLSAPAWLAELVTGLSQNTSNPLILDNGQIVSNAEELVAARRRRGAQPPPGSTRGLDLLWDIKTIHGGSDSYTCALARDAQGGAVTQRARQVDAEYARIALRLGPRRPPAGVRPVRPGGVREWSFTPLGRLLHGLVAALEG